MLNEEDALAQAKELYGTHKTEREQLDELRRYWKGRQRLPMVIPQTAPREVKVMARIGRVNVCEIVVNSLAQSTFVDGFRSGSDEGNLEVWQAWQANKMDARQAGIHRAAFAYGTSYAVVLPGDPYPVIRGCSPRNLTAMYGEDPDWPVYALERRGRGQWRLYDDQAVYSLTSTPNTGDDSFKFAGGQAHELGVCPVIRYQDQDDLDLENDVRPHETLLGREVSVPNSGQIAALMALQDQIDLTTFGLLTTQWYQQFRQRYVIGWVPDDEKEKMNFGASQVLTFEDSPDEVKIGEFAQSDMGGYITSREASLRHAATLSQTPVHELTGQLANLAADAIRAAESGKDLKVSERKTLLGESHEQMLGLVGDIMGLDIPDDAETIWRDTSIQTFPAVVDALGKLSQMLDVPPQELWDRVPGTTQQELERWKAAAGEGDAFKNLTALLGRQSGDIPPPPPPAPPAVQ